MRDTGTLSGTSLLRRAALQAVRCRTLVVGGLRDTIAPPADLLQFARSGLVENLILLNDTGHWPMIEHPDVFNDTVTQFLWNQSLQQAGEERR